MQGFNMGRYHPPSSLDKSLAEKSSHGFNKQANGKRTQATGPPTVRFEMPFAIWCTTCTPEAIIGQGVRFNAQKAKVGNYHTSPIWGFTMKHTTCGGLIEIRTDPQLGDYVVEKGARRRDYGDDGDSREGKFGEILTEEDRARRAADPFAHLEGRVEQKEKAKKEGWWVEKLQDHKDRDWDDVWSANRRLRKTFRVERKDLQEKDQNREELAERLGLAIDVLDEVAEDGQRAALMSYGETDISAERNVTVSVSRPLFDKGRNQEAVPTTVSTTKAQKKTAESISSLKKDLRGNTRAVVDPFLNENPRTPKSGQRLAGVKRKRVSDQHKSPPLDDPNHKRKPAQSASLIQSNTPLVAYDSDDD
ncbi:DUF572-domain-containing protein [Microthyrium microscopicum]|uniref:DUF572-domain-containing protein n=1 Tax=Microthyrium microscopicum TaxID=703497 RepID=A0A6A6UFE8_9PEZI|nr:DUF572-domain-containing protein [Microthyrium microscopicum]